MFGAFSAGQAKQYGPSTGKGLQAAKKIFLITNEKGKIDPFDQGQDDLIYANSATLKGEIQFIDIWFRYPTRRHWILKGINFRINAQETVGLVGQSGSGKSTITQLIYRFYDPQFGQILIDGIDIK